MAARVVDAYWTDAAGDGDFQNGENWFEVGVDFMLAADYPDAGSTLDVDNYGSYRTPTYNQPSSGAYHFNLREGSSFSPFDLLGGASVGNVAISSGLLYLGSSIGGTLTMTGGTLRIEDHVTVTGAATLNGGTIEAAGAYLLTFTLIPTGSGLAIDWGNGGLDIAGGLNLTTCTHYNTSQEGGENLLSCDVDGNFNLGGPAENVHVFITPSGSVTPVADIVCGPFTLAGGTYGASTKTHTIHGNLSVNAGALGANTGVWTLAMDGSTFVVGYARTLHLALAANVSATSTGDCFLRSLSGPASATIIMTRTAVIVTFANNMWDFDGRAVATGLGELWIEPNTGFTNAKPIIVEGPLVIRGANGVSCTCPAVSATGLKIYGNNDNRTVSLLTSALTTDSVTLGGASTERNGVLSVSGACSIGSLIRIGTGTGNALVLNSSSVRLSGTLNAAGILVTNTAAKIIGGTITGLDASATAEVRAYRCVGESDATNKNVRFRKRLGSGSGGGLLDWNRVA